MTERPADVDPQNGEPENLPVPASLLFGNRAYDLVRATTTVILPGLATLYLTIAQILGLPYGTEVTAVVAAVCTFLGLLLTVSRRQYNNQVAEEAANVDYDGVVTVIPDPGSGNDNLNFALDPAKIAAKDELVIRVDKQ